jgi:hypothetical protein
MIGLYRPDFMLITTTPLNYSFENLLAIIYEQDPIKVRKGLKKGLSFDFHSLLVDNWNLL